MNGQRFHQQTQIETKTEQCERGLRELSFFKLGTGGGRIFGGAPDFLAAFRWGIKYFDEIAKHLMGCEIFGIYFRFSKIAYFL